jgi:hypothetical protein
MSAVPVAMIEAPLSIKLPRRHAMLGEPGPGDGESLTTRLLPPYTQVPRHTGWRATKGGGLPSEDEEEEKAGINTT